MVVVVVPALGSFASLIQTLDQDSNDVGRLQGKCIFQHIKLSYFLYGQIVEWPYYEFRRCRPDMMRAHYYARRQKKIKHHINKLKNIKCKTVCQCLLRNYICHSTWWVRHH